MASELLAVARLDVIIHSSRKRVVIKPPARRIVATSLILDFVGQIEIHERFEFYSENVGKLLLYVSVARLIKVFLRTVEKSGKNGKRRTFAPVVAPNGYGYVFYIAFSATLHGVFHRRHRVSVHRRETRPCPRSARKRDAVGHGEMFFDFRIVMAFGVVIIVPIAKSYVIGNFALISFFRNMHDKIRPHSRLETVFIGDFAHLYEMIV